MRKKRRKRGTPRSSEIIESNQSVQQGSIPERGSGFFGSRNRIATVLVAGGILATALYLNNNRSSGEESGNEAASAWLQPDPVKPEQVEKFDLRTYHPPKSGRVWKTHFSESSEKSIVYIPDIHTTGKDPKGRPVQGQAFAILEDAIKKYGKVPVVIEGWADYDDSKETFRRNIEGDKMTTIAAEPDIRTRKKMVLELIQQGEGPAGSSLATVYQDEIDPVPSQTKAELRRALRNMMLSGFVGNIRKKNAPCSTVGVPEAHMGISSALNQDSAKSITPELVACQCTYLGIRRSVLSDFWSSRMRAAVREVRRAVEHKSPFIFVIAGTAHVSTAMKKMEEENVNYVVVAPHSNDMRDTNIPKMPSIDSCEQWVADHKEKIEKEKQALRAFIAERASKIGY